mmetsp:Transcript_40201/g.64605  ORF Transcript_40201/g.64605 Transcript_40201/m.64605 type:complete len:185 (-) Transcript_40201:150-704(-)
MSLCCSTSFRALADAIFFQALDTVLACPQKHAISEAKDRIMLTKSSLPVTKPYAEEGGDEGARREEQEVEEEEEEEEEDAEEAKRLHHQQQEEHRLPNEPVDLRVAAIKLEGGRGHHGYNGGDHTINWSRNDDNDENEKNEKGIDEINCSGKRQQQKKFQTSTPTAPPSSSSSIDNFYQDHAID